MKSTSPAQRGRRTQDKTEYVNVKADVASRGIMHSKIANIQSQRWKNAQSSISERSSNHRQTRSHLNNNTAQIFNPQYMCLIKTKKKKNKLTSHVSHACNSSS